MALFALVNSGIVHALSEGEDAWPHDLFDVRDVSHVADIAIGWLATDDGFAAPPPPPVVVVVPTSASKLGLKRALAETGELAVFPEPEWPAVKAALASNPDLQEDWDLATEIRRVDPLTQAMIAARSYSPAQVDALLIRANELVA
ncbi:hypothetical protein [Methylobacterium haplocladii]|uniref:Uncharacterized protein n=1 Tax=Methylobacterium haplocladii TaxID=1176176 RepID=A0A512ISD0_9HYPH|nr:hypothetical protein [Methylobacterium haplocladii]GEP00622.1 hypothetical protein MHA02_30090 [Methylobacterium haplocladii]GJD85537.1 hypothetical protein HPGCJGGD_3426 [Methylobacterium haplocladii]GLS57770.1 hypothetical protein GCM10007887_04260 [Methylobacterium haplocladii]